MNPRPFGVNFEACFLGPSGENADIFRELVASAVESHVAWRQAFHRHDAAPFISPGDRRTPDFARTVHTMRQALDELQERLQQSQPFFSPRYIGHMNWEVLTVSIVAFLNAALYNPNNVALAGSTATSQLEIEVGRDLVRLFGMDGESAWAHLCAGGTIANMEALWIARNMKVLPLVLGELVREHGLTAEFELEDRTVRFSESSDAQLLRALSPSQVLQLRDAVVARAREAARDRETGGDRQRAVRRFEHEVERRTLSGRGLGWTGSPVDVGVVFYPQTRHYSLKKALDLLGIGFNNAVDVPVDSRFRMDVEALEAGIRAVVARGRPVLAVVAVLGSTEESAVDRVGDILALRSRLERELDVSFHLHVDAAYGGYARSLFIDEAGEFMNKAALDEYLREMDIIGDKPERSYASWPDPAVFDAYRATPGADSITVDPHKLGYVLYPAGGLVLRDKRMREAIRAYAPYVFPRPKPGEPDVLIGSYILEGSKPGAAAAAVWMAHRLMPLNITGYGKLIGETIDGAQALWWGLDHLGPLPVGDGLSIDVHGLTKPDLNIVNYVFNFTGNRDLSRLNALTGYFCDEILGPLPRTGETMLDKRFIVSSTEFTVEAYGDSPVPFLSRIGITEAEWRRVGALKVARSVIMSPYMTPDYVDANYVRAFGEYLRAAAVEHRERLAAVAAGEEC